MHYDGTMSNPYENLTSDSGEWEEAAEQTAQRLLDHVEGWLKESGAQPETIAMVLYKMATAIPERCLAHFDPEDQDGS